MCSRKCDTPATSADSSRLPVLTKNPEATDRAWSFSSAMTWRPLSRTVWWNCIEEASAEDGRGGSPHRHERSPREIHRGGRPVRKPEDRKRSQRKYLIGHGKASALGPRVRMVIASRSWLEAYSATDPGVSASSAAEISS